MKALIALQPEAASSLKQGCKDGGTWEETTTLIKNQSADQS